MSTQLEALNTDEKIELLKQEKIVRDGRETFVKVGMALEVIRDRKLYRQTYGTFEEYCQEKWKFSRQYASQLITGAAAVKALPPSLSRIVDNPRVAAELAKVPEKSREEVVRKAKASGKPVTGKAIKEKAKEVDESKPKFKELCETGAVIPDKLLPLWRRRDEVLIMMKEISNIKCVVERGLADEDPLFGELNNGFVADANQLRSTLSQALPYAVCTGCNGQLTEKCTLCNGRGFLSKLRYQTVPKEIRDMRDKVVAARVKAARK